MIGSGRTGIGSSRTARDGGDAGGAGGLPTSTDGSVIITTNPDGTPNLSVPNAASVVIGQVMFGVGVQGTDDVVPVGVAGIAAYMGAAMDAVSIGTPTDVLSDSPRYGFAVPFALQRLRLRVFITRLVTTGLGSTAVQGFITINGVRYTDLGWGIATDGAISTQNVVQDNTWDVFVPAGSNVGVTIETLAGQGASNCQVHIVIEGGAQVGTPAPVADPILWLRGDMGLVADEDGNAVSWADQSGFDRDATVPVDYFGPPVTANAIGAVSGVSFAPWNTPVDAVIMTGPLTPAATRPYTVMAVTLPSSILGGAAIGVGGLMFGLMDDGSQYIQFPNKAKTVINDYTDTPTFLIVTVSAAGAARAWVNGLEVTLAAGTIPAPSNPGYSVGGVIAISGSVIRTAGAVVTELEVWEREFSDVDAAQQYVAALEKYGL